MHVAIGTVVRNPRIPPPHGFHGRAVDQRQTVVVEEAEAPALAIVDHVAELVEAVLVDGAVAWLAGGGVDRGGFLVEIVEAVFVGEDDDVLVAVEVVWVVVFVGEGEEEVLELGEGE